MTALALRIGGDVSGLDKAMQRASDIVTTRGKQMVLSAVQTGKQMDTAFTAYKAIRFAADNSTALTTALRGTAVALGTVAVGIGIIKGLEAATKAAAEQVERLVKIGNAARDNGVSSTFFQLWTGQAKFLRVEADDLAKSLERLKSASTVKLGEGSGDNVRNQSALEARLRQQVQAGNIGQPDLNRFLSAGDNEQRLRVLLDLMRELQSKGRELAAIDIGSQFLSPAMLEGIRNGTIELDRLKARLSEVKSADVQIFEAADIENAREMQRRLEEAYRIINNELKPIYEDFAAAGRDFYGSTVSWVESLAGGVRLLAQAYQIIKSISGVVASTPGLSVGNPTANTPAGKPGAQIGAVLAGKDIPADPAVGLAQRLGATDPGATKALAALAKRMNPTAVANDMAKSRQMTDGIKPDKSAPIITGTKASGGSSGGGSTDRTSSLYRYVTQLEKARDVAKAEADTAGLGAVAKERAVTLARAQAAAQQDVKDGLRASVDLTDAERSKIESAAEATAKWREEAKATADTLEFTKSLAGDALKGFLGDLREGKTLGEALKNTLDRIATKVFDKLIDGLIGGLLGGATGGFNLFKIFGFADGGPVKGPGTARSDSIPARLSNGEYVINARATAQHRDLLDAINSGQLPRFADGGLVSAIPVSVPSIPRTELPREAAAGASISQTVQVNVSGGSSGDPKKDQAMADMIGKRVQQELRSMVGAEIKQQLRPGGIIREASR